MRIAAKENQHENLLMMYDCTESRIFDSHSTPDPALDEYTQTPL